MPVDKKLTFKLGADPEFLLFYGNKVVHAREAFVTYMVKEGMPGVDAGFKVDNAGNIGWDGHPATGEMRPAAANSPKGLTDNIGILLQAVHKAMPFLDISTLSIGSPTGGHIHVDIANPQIMENPREKSRISRLVATFLIPIVASEHRICTAYRASSSYGNPADLRMQQIPGSGGKYTLEIRGPSAEWTTTPKIAECTLAYIATVWTEIQKRHELLAKTEVALKTEQQIKATYGAIISDYKPTRDGIMKAITETVRTFELYPKYKEEIEYILNFREVYNDKEKVGWNINQGWNFDDKKAPSKRALLSEKTVSAKSKDVDMQLLDTSFNVSYNDDYNVQMFSQALSQRIAGLGWKLKYEYFLYGLKKGVDGFLAQEGNTEELIAVPSNMIKDDVKATTKKMRDRYADKGKTNLYRIDPKTGKARIGFNDVMIIGLPYEMRQKKDVKEFIDLIWKIEQKKLKPKPIGKWKIPTSLKESPEEGII